MSEEKISELEKFHRSLRDKRQADHVKAVIALSKGYLPDFTLNSRFEEKTQDRITLRHLLTHSAGISHEAPVGNYTDVRFPSFAAHAESISETWLKWRVGERWFYSNIGIDLAAYIVQVVSGHSFADYMKDKIFDPLNMPNSSVDNDIIQQHPNRAQGIWPHVREDPPCYLLGAGGVYTSAKELASFVQFFLNRGKIDDRPLLAEIFIDEMYTPVTTSKNYDSDTFLDEMGKPVTIYKTYGLGIGHSQKHDTYRLNHRHQQS